MTLRTVRRRASLFAAAVGLCLAVWPIAASADGIVRHTDPVKQVSGTVSSTVNTITEPAGGVISEVKDTVAAVVGDAVDSVGQALGSSGSSGGSTGSETTNAPASGSTGSGSSVSTAKSSGSAGSASSPSRSTRVLSSAGAAGLAATGAFSSLYQAFAPPPPRYGGLSGGTLATTGLDFLLPLGVLVVLLAIGLGMQAMQRVRANGALRYRGRHRMPSRWGPQLSPAY